MVVLDCRLLIISKSKYTQSFSRADYALERISAPSRLAYFRWYIYIRMEAATDK